MFRSSRSFLRLLPITLLALPLAFGASIPTARADDEPPHTVFLPITRNDGAAPDLIFSPNAVNLAPGASASVQVRVEPQADLRGATFDLPGAQDGVTNHFESAADGTSGTLTIEASAASEAGERPLTVQGQSGVDTGKTWTGALKITTSATLTAKTVFVDAKNGNNNADGSQSRPLKTLTKALTKVVAGDTVKLLPGSYTNTGSGDLYPLTIPNGVTIAGTRADNGAQQSFLSPASSAAGTTGLVFAGDATVKDLELDVFGTAMQASKGKQTFTNLLMFGNRISMQLIGTAQITLKGSAITLNTNARAVDIFEQSQFTMDGGTITGGDARCELSNIGLFILESGQATLKNQAKLQNIGGSALRMGVTAKATLDNAAIENLSPAACDVAPQVTMRDSTSLTLKNKSSLVQNGNPGLNSIAISGAETNNNASQNVQITLDQAFITGFAVRGLSLSGKGSLVMKGGLIAVKGIGIDASSLMQLTVSDAQITVGTAFGERLAIRASNLKLRDSNVSGSGIKILSFGKIDLGTVSDPGNNKLGNSTPAVALDQSSGSGIIEAVGNTWNANQQGADASGHYNTRQTASGPTPNGGSTVFSANFLLFTANQKINL